jgi:hypothetical protein
MLSIAVWYRHWLEIRAGLLVAFIFITVLSLFYPVFLVGSSDWFAQAGAITKELSVFASQFPAMGSERFFPWGAHAWICSAAALFVYIPLWGTGIRTNNLQPGHASLYYTLTLPISRFGLIWTRFLTSCTATFLLFAAMLFFDCTVLLLMGRPVPLGPMAASSFLAGLLVLPALAVFGLLSLLDEKHAGWVLVAAVYAEIRWAWTPATGFIAGEVSPWNTIATIFLIVAATLLIARVVAHKKDF